MTAVEEIEAAIVELEALKVASTPGPWTAPAAILGLKSTTIFGTPIDGGHAAYVATAHDAELIVTLHRTIDAQLAILRHVADGRGDLGIGTNRYVVALARAINGVSS